MPDPAAKTAWIEDSSFLPSACLHLTNSSWKASPQAHFPSPKPGVGTIAGCTPTVLRVGFLGGDRPW